MLKFEFEGCRIKETGWNSLSAAVKFRPKFGIFAPYAVLGAGGEFEKLNFHFSDYRFYTFIGGGFHLFFTSMFSLRFDLRFLHFSDARPDPHQRRVFHPPVACPAPALSYAGEYDIDKPLFGYKYVLTAKFIAKKQFPSIFRRQG